MILQLHCQLHDYWIYPVLHFQNIGPYVSLVRFMVEELYLKSADWHDVKDWVLFGCLYFPHRLRLDLDTFIHPTRKAGQYRMKCDLVNILHNVPQESCVLLGDCLNALGSHMASTQSICVLRWKCSCSLCRCKLILSGELQLNKGFGARWQSVWGNNRHFLDVYFIYLHAA